MPDRRQDPSDAHRAGASHALAGQMARPSAGFVLFGLAVLVLGEGGPLTGLALIGIGGGLVAR